MNKYKRRNYLIDKSFQLRYMAMVAIFMVFISIGTGCLIYFTTWITLIEKLGDKAPLDIVFADLNKIILVRIVLLVLASICLSAIITMFIVHRVAGPLFRVKLTMRQIGKGIIPAGKVKFRTRDELQDLAEAVNEAVCKIEEVREKNLKVIEEASGYAERLINLLRFGLGPEVQKPREELELLKESLEKFEIFQKELNEKESG
jgi:sensor histidine kinase YesM